jgi:cell division protein ZipA
LVAELRWILLGLCLLLLAVIWWWSARRTGQAPGNAELRESTAGTTPHIAPPLDPRYLDPDDDDMRPAAEPRDWGVPPFEPLSIRTAEFDRVPVLDRPMMVSADPESRAAATPAAAAPAALTPDAAAPGAAAPASGTAAAATRTTASMPATAARVSATPTAPPPAPNAAELQKIVTIRVCTLGEGRWPGAQLMAALELHGLAFGRYQVFHRNHVDGRSLFCVASLVEPGTFDIAAMPGQEFRGVTLFAVLPGPIAPVETMDELFATARGLAEELSGMVQDAKGMPLSPQRAAALREDIARFQASLPRNC